MAVLAKIAKVTGTFFSLVKTRLELATVEIEEEALRLILSACLSLAAVFCLFLFFTLASVLVIVLCWDSYRIEAIVGLMIFYALVALILGLCVRSRFRNKPKFLELTFQEISNDINRFKS